MSQVERTMENLSRLRDMKISHGEAHWLLGVLANTQAMTSALDLLADRRGRDMTERSEES